jgi:delta(3,5)-delta(2,4)-dienoyl-CoA isomerase
MRVIRESIEQCSTRRSPNRQQQQASREGEEHTTRNTLHYSTDTNTQERERKRAWIDTLALWSATVKSLVRTILADGATTMASSASSSSSAASALAALGQYKTLQLSWASAGVLQLHIKCGPLNLMSRAFWREMREVGLKIAECKEARVVWVTSEGKVFTGGLDLQDHMDAFSGADSELDVSRRAIRMRSFVTQYQSSFSVLEALPQPVVVSIHGACIGGGVDLITACDIRLASQEAYFSIKEVDVGMAADVGTLQRLPKVVGNQSLVREWAYTGRKIPAAEALSAGLLSRVFANKEELAKESLALCKLIASKSPIAVTGTKSQLLFSRDHSVPDSLEYVATWNAAMLQSSDVIAAMQASMERKQPIFSNL